MKLMCLVKDSFHYFYFKGQVLSFGWAHTFTTKVNGSPACTFKHRMCVLQCAILLYGSDFRVNISLPGIKQDMQSTIFRS